MVARLDATDKRILLIVKLCGGMVKEMELHRKLYELKKSGVRVNLKFVEDPPFSPDLRAKLSKLTESGYLREFYLVGTSYLQLYEKYYKLTEKAESVLEKLDIDKRDVTKIYKYFGIQEKEVQQAQ